VRWLCNIILENIRWHNSSDKAGKSPVSHKTYPEDHLNGLQDMFIATGELTFS
jgi:hypothetical protein